jgi:putative transposase
MMPQKDQEFHYLKSPEKLSRQWGVPHGGSLRREVLDHVILLNEGHLERVLKEYIEEFYHTDRPHQGLGGQAPEPTPRPTRQPSKVRAIPVLGGLHHRYVPIAA